MVVVGDGGDDDDDKPYSLARMFDEHNVKWLQIWVVKWTKGYVRLLKV